MNENVLCKNCEAELNGPFCGQCGQKVVEQRITIKSIFSSLFEIITNLERGFWYTIIQTFKNPGIVVRDFLNGKTKPYYNPFRLVFILATVSTIIMISTGVYDIMQSTMGDIMGQDQMDENQRKIQEFTKNYLNLITLLAIPPIAYVSSKLYKIQELNFAEHIVAVCFFWTISTIIGGLLTFMYLLVPSIIPYSQFVGVLLSSSTLAYGYSRLFKVKLSTAFIKGLLAVILGFLMMILTIIILTIIVVIIILVVKKLIL